MALMEGRDAAGRLRVTVVFCSWWAVWRDSVKQEGMLKTDGGTRSPPRHCCYKTLSASCYCEKAVCSPSIPVSLTICRALLIQGEALPGDRIISVAPEV